MARQARLGVAGLGAARQDKAGEARQGAARHGVAWQDKAGTAKRCGDPGWGRLLSQKLRRLNSSSPLHKESP